MADGYPGIGGIQYEVDMDKVTARMWIQKDGEMVSLPIDVPHACLLMSSCAAFISLYHAHAARKP